MEEVQGEFKPTYELIPRLFAARRAQIAALVGTDAVEQLDTVYPHILALCRDKMGYTMVNAVKSP